MARIGSLSIKLGLSTAEFNKNLSKASKRVRRVGRRMRRSFNRVGKSIGRMTAALILVAGPIVLGALVVSSMKAIDHIGKMSVATGIATDSLTTFHTLAALAGVEIKTFDKAMIKVARSIRDADDGLTTYVRAFDKLGLSAKELKKLSPEEQFFRINKALANVSNATDRLAIATDLYGAKAAKMLNMTGLSREAFMKLKEESLKLGVALTRIDVSKVEASNDAMTKAKKAVEGLGNRIAVGLSPFIKKMSDDFYQAALDSGGFADSVKSGISTALKAVGWFLDAMRFLKIGWVTINLAFQVVVAGVVNGVILIVDALNKLSGINIELSESFREFGAATKAVMDETAQSLVDLTSKPLPSTALDKWVEDAEKASEKVARAFVKTQKAQKAAAKKSGQDEEKAAADQLALGKDSALKGIGLTKWKAMKEGLINLKSAVMGAYTWGNNIGGPLVGLAAAAAAFKFQSSQLAELGGGGGGMGGGGGGLSNDVVDVPEDQLGTNLFAQERRDIQITIRGIDPDKLYTGEQMRDLIERIAESEATGVTF